jgi:hypothetical protein
MRKSPAAAKKAGERKLKPLKVGRRISAGSGCGSSEATSPLGAPSRAARRAIPGSQFDCAGLAIRQQDDKEAQWTGKLQWTVERTPQGQKWIYGQKKRIWGSSGAGTRRWH